jgi:5-formyltetrahydrofolate cyclo-ligase
VTGKPEAREFGRKVRAGLSAEARVDWSRRIVVRCREELDWGAWRRVHVFLPIGAQGEVDTWPLVGWLWYAHPELEVYVPRLVEGRMEHVRIDRETQFRTNALGIPEPMSGEVLGPGVAVDAVLTPLLAFDERGHRVGYGGGFYDRFLAGQPRALKVGLAYEACLVREGIMTEAHDVRLDVVVTERRVVWPS